MLAVNHDGVVGVSWYDASHDRREYRSAFRCQRVLFAASQDNGATFSTAMEVSSSENCPDTDLNEETGRRYPAGGEYHGLTTTSDGRFHLLWADSRSGVYQLRRSTVSIESSR